MTGNQIRTAERGDNWPLATADSWYFEHHTARYQMVVLAQKG